MSVHTFVSPMFSDAVFFVLPLDILSENILNLLMVRYISSNDSHFVNKLYPLYYSLICGKSIE